MIGYLMVGTNNFDKAATFYDGLFAEMGAGRIMEEEGTFIVWGTSLEDPGFSITLPFDKQPATSGNGAMTAFLAADTDTVKKLHARALELGATDEGAPGPRGDSGFYAGYCRDLDGNKFNFFCMAGAGS